MGTGRWTDLKQAAVARLRRHAGSDELAARADAADGRLDVLAAELAAARAALGSTGERADAAIGHQGELERHLHEIRDEIATQQRHVQVQTVMDWIAGVTLREEPLISVVLPTRNRAELLPRAVATVLAQSYANWELLIVDDASSDATASVIASFDDPRIRAFTGQGRGVCAARNVTLNAAAGSLVAYIDDDNRMHPEWLRSVAWAFEQHPETEVLYGAFVIDDLRRAQRRGAGDLPCLVLTRYARAALEQHNITDIGAIAHRASLPEAHFDEALREMGDWDLFLRLTRDTVPLTLPAIACYYESHATDRLSAGPTHEVDGDRIRSKAR